MRPQSGFTLIESLIAASLALVVITSLLAATIFIHRTFVGIGNYVQLDRQTRAAMDRMSRDIRQSAALTNGTSTSLSFTNIDGSLLQYQYDAQELRQLHVFTVPVQPCSRQLHVVYQRDDHLQLQSG